MRTERLFLAIDVGNTSVKMGVFAGAELIARLHSPTSTCNVGDMLSALETDPRFDANAFDGVGICSVVPVCMEQIRGGVQETLGIPCWVVGPETDFGLKILPDPPDAIGRDRLVNAAAAAARYGRPAIVVSIGTATTVDAVSSDGSFLGGAIAPGPGTAYEALVKAGAQLPHAPLEMPPRAIGRNTTEAMQSGAVLGYAGLLDGLIERIRAEMEGQPIVVATGGWTSLFLGVAKEIGTMDPSLTLDGIRRLWEINAGASPDAATGGGRSTE